MNFRLIKSYITEYFANDTPNQITSARLEKLYKNARLLYWSEHITIIAVIMALFLADALDLSQALLTWISCIIFLEYLYKKFLTSNLRKQPIKTQAKNLHVRQILYTLPWAVFLYTTLHPLNTKAFLALSIVFVASTTNGAALFTTYFSIYATHYIPSVITAWLCSIFLINNIDTSVIRWGTPLYVISYLFYARKITRGAIREIRLRLDNDQLILKLEQEILRTKALERTKGEFYLAASHDLRQPLNALGLYMDSMPTSNLSAEQQYAWRQVRDSAQSCRELLRNLFEFSLHESGRLAANPRTIDVDSMLNKISFDYGVLADIKGLVFRYRECGLHIMADPLILDQIIRNLLTNAIKFTTSGGILVGVRKRLTQKQIVIEIWDTGPGFQDSVLPSSATAESPSRLADGDAFHRGAGLGLMIVQRLLPYLDGAVLTHRTERNRGTVFRLILPWQGGSLRSTEN